MGVMCERFESQHFFRRDLKSRLPITGNAGRIRGWIAAARCFVSTRTAFQCAWSLLSTLSSCKNHAHLGAREPRGSECRSDLAGMVAKSTLSNRRRPLAPHQKG